MASVWRSKAWKARVRELLDAFPRCEWCNGYSRVINHQRQGFYPGYELCRREEIDIICMECHQEWSKNGRKRHRLYDDCTACGAAVYRGRKVCWICGSDEIKGSDLDPEKRLRLSRILARCPEVKVGDVWSNVWTWQAITIIRFEKQETLPWPMVKIKYGEGEVSGEVGLPAFLFGRLEKRGKGPSWKSLFEEEVGEEKRPSKRLHPYS